MGKNAFDPKYHHRNSIRLKAYDYSKTGFYFFTICAKNKACLFGQVTKGEMILNDAGMMIEKEWLKIGERFQYIRLHESVVMPNHFHAIYEVENPKNTNITGDIVGAFKSISTVEYIRGVKGNDWPSFEDRLWQRNYWEHVIRDETSHQKISNYIQNTPVNWKTDDLNPDDLFFTVGSPCGCPRRMRSDVHVFFDRFGQPQGIAPGLLKSCYKKGGHLTIGSFAPWSFRTVCS